MNRTLEKKLVAYITSSFPNNNFTIDLCLNLKEVGVDIIELGIPFSDPVADGPIIEKANFLALKNNFKLKDLFEVSSKIAPHIKTFFMGYANSFYSFKMEDILKKMKELKIKGSIIPDLPYEMAQEYTKLYEKYEQTNITFIAPTSGEKRIKTLVKKSSEFIYLVAYAGITGNTKEEDLSKIIKTIRENTKTPIYLGFGVNKDTCKQKAKDVDGLIVGSAFVKYLIDESLSQNKKLAKITCLAKEIKERINE